MLVMDSYTDDWSVLVGRRVVLFEPVLNPRGSFSLGRPGIEAIGRFEVVETCPDSTVWTAEALDRLEGEPEGGGVIAFVGVDGNIWTCKPNGADLRQTLADTEPGLSYDSPTWSPNGDYLAALRYAISGPTDDVEVWVARADGSDLKMVATTWQGIFAWTHVPGELATVSTREVGRVDTPLGRATDTEWSIYVTNVSDGRRMLIGSGRRLVYPGIGGDLGMTYWYKSGEHGPFYMYGASESLKWSPDGTAAYLETPFCLFRLELDTGQMTDLGPEEPRSPREETPFDITYSSAPVQLAALWDGALALADDGGGWRPLADESQVGGALGSHLRIQGWSASGDELYVEDYDPATQTGDVARISLPNSSIIVVFSNAWGRTFGRLTVASDGSRIAYSVGTGDPLEQRLQFDSRIYVAASDGTNVVDLYPGRYPAWQPVQIP
jgi:hypothetical protein